MHRLIKILTRSSLSLLIIIMTMFYPLGAPMVTASPASETVPPATESTSQSSPALSESDSSNQTETTSPQSETSEPACAEPKGTKRPTGADAHTYRFNETECIWENEYYTWNPVTKQKTKKTPHDYVYSPASKSWRKLEPPAPLPTQAAADNALGANDHPVSASESASPNATGTAGGDDTDLSQNTDATLTNFLWAHAHSGDVNLIANTSVGDASTGDAATTAMIINMLQSSASFAGGNVATFSADIQGDVYGDLFVDPALLATLQPSARQLNGNVDIAVQTGSQIHNDITLHAKSGDARVERNTKAGTVSTGNAQAVLNLVNLVNSAINSGGSFVGMLNIYGNLNGDILLPEDVLNQLIATNHPPKTTLDTSRIENSEVLADLTSNQTIHNDITVEASSGDLTLAGNTKSGDAASGNVSTNLTVLNLTGRQVTAHNSLLVFVNVLGQWVGLIMNAPAGTTSAALGTGVSRNTLGFSDQTHIDADSSSAIHNNVTVAAQSGDAQITQNTQVGDARTGDASASANIVNIMNSSFALSDWFGMLFINVFGTWHGSFGINTAAGDPRPAAGGRGGSQPTSVSSEDIRVFRFVPAAEESNYRIEPVSLEQETPDDAQATLSAGTQDGGAGISGGSSHTRPSVESGADTGRSYMVPILSVLAGAAILGIERLISLRQRRLA